MLQDQSHEGIDMAGPLEDVRRPGGEGVGLMSFAP
jgi:hypothetical protein